MKFSRIKKYRKKHSLLSALLIRNPVLVMGLDLPFVIAGAVSLKNAAAMSIQMLMIHMVTMLAGMLTCRALPYWLRVLVNTCVSTGMMMAARALVVPLFPGVTNSLGMYLYLMAVNGMTVLLSSSIDKRAKLWPVITGALGNVAGFSLVAFLIALLREYMGSGTIWGVAVPVPLKLDGLLIPFFGFILTGFLLAGARFLNKRLLAFVMLEAARKDTRYTRIVVDSVETLEHFAPPPVKDTTKKPREEP